MRALLLLLILHVPVRAEQALGESYDRLSGALSEAPLRLLGRPPVDPLKRRSIFRIISWNVQTFGENVHPAREAAYGELLDMMFSKSRSSKILATQEIANKKGADKFQALLPGGTERWNPSFQDTVDSQDNGFFTQKQVATHCERFLFAKQDSDGRWQSDPSRARHPVRIAHMAMGDFDFTLITLHLAFGGGDSEGSARELRNVLDWLKDYYADPRNDPDVVIAGDFNLPTTNGQIAGEGVTVDGILSAYPAFRLDYDSEGRRVKKPSDMYVLVDAPTSRSGGTPVNNYDHFIISGDVFDEEYVADSAGVLSAKLIDKIEREHETRVSDHLPISAGFLYKGEGNDGRAVARDLPELRGPGSGPCWRGVSLLSSVP